MAKVRLLLNSLILIVLGATMVSISIEITWMLVRMRNYIHISRLIDNFYIGLIVGTVVVLLHILIIRFRRKPVLGFTVSAIGVATVLIAVYVHTGLTMGYWTVDVKWLIILIMAEGFTIPLVGLWYRQIRAYSHQLEIKKSSLRK